MVQQSTVDSAAFVPLAYAEEELPMNPMQPYAELAETLDELQSSLVTGIVACYQACCPLYFILAFPNNREAS